jgi:uncharacterized protein (DUF1786 family)
MRILTVDIGTGTQDIFLYDSRLDLENGFKLIVPSPTMMVHQRLREATRRGQAVLLTGVTMGGGPSQWAVEAHLRAGFPVYATPAAARSFNDELAAVEAMGVCILSEDEAQTLPSAVLRVELKDFAASAIARALQEFGVSLDTLDAVGVAVFDHGNAPPGYSDRQFRFDYLDQRLRAVQNTSFIRHLPFSQSRNISPSTAALSTFAYRAAEIPPVMTRLQAVVRSFQHSGISEIPLVVMDTAPAAVLGATFDPQVMPLLARHERVMVANIGNFHTLAFRLGRAGVEGVFEHHTGLLDLPRLETLLLGLAQGSLQHSQVFEQHGHGALMYASQPLELGLGEFDVVVTGPRRSLYQRPGCATQLRPYFAVPFGDMMITGCIGLLAATAVVLPELSETILESLTGPGKVTKTPWDDFE